jgi:hypothetical protein
MKTLALLLVATVLVALPTSCKSTHSESVPCVCGTQLGDLEGCEHARCRAGEQNPDNPNCVCGQLEIPGQKKQ